MVKALIRRVADDAGSATIEVAIIMPLLLLLVVGAADFARIYRAQITVAGAAQAGAQYGSRTKLKAGDTDGMIRAAQHDAADLEAVQATARRFCLCGGATAACTSICGDGHTPEVYVEVKVATTYKTAVRYPGVPHNVPLAHTATMRAE